MKEVVVNPKIKTAWAALPEKQRVEVFGRNYWQQGIVINLVDHAERGTVFAIGSFHGGHPFDRSNRKKRFKSTSNPSGYYPQDVHWWGVDYADPKKPEEMIQMYERIHQFARNYPGRLKFLNGVQKCGRIAAKCTNCDYQP
jgi:hypothetical protein